MNETVSGTVEKIIFRNEQNFYTVASIETDEKLLTIVGNFANISVGLKIEASGKFVENQKYGRQFQVQTIDMSTPKDEDSIFSYISSGMLPGIGPKKAREIIDCFGDKTLEIIGNHPEQLTKVKGIGKKTALLASAYFNKQENIRDVIMELGKFDIKPNYAKKLYNEYHEKTLQVITNNPYALIDDIYGIGFQRADKIAMSVGIEMSSPYRVTSGIKHILKENFRNGDCYIIKEKLVEEAAKLLFVDPEIVTYNIDILIDNGSIILETFDNESRCFSPELYHAETESAKMLIRLDCFGFDKKEIDFDNLINKFEDKNGIKLDKKQKDAVINAINNKVSIITGGPGTGKTTIINAIIYILGDINKKYILTAPTGRAAKRMSEATENEAKTIHRLLEYEYGGENNFLSFGKNEENKLDTDYIIVDEMSMVDITLLFHFLKAVREDSHLIFVGDVDQLPSVGAGNVLSDLINSNIFNVIRLDTIHRQSEKSMIVYNAHEINKGNMIDLNTKSTDFFFVEAVTQSKIARRIYGIIENHFKNPLRKYDLTDDVQIISPLKKGTAGVIELNHELQKILNPKTDYNQEEVTFAGYTYRANDKIMQMRNDYMIKWKNQKTGKSGMGIYNGEMGIIQRVDKNTNSVEILFDDDKITSYPFELMAQINLAYATTVHKSQGSEFKAVIIPVFSGYYGFLTRNLLYTAITRAKDMVILVGEKNALSQMIKNVQKSKRNTTLVEKLTALV